MVSNVKDNNPLGMQKTVSLDFIEEQVREGRRGNLKNNQSINLAKTVCIFLVDRFNFYFPPRGIGYKRCENTDNSLFVWLFSRIFSHQVHMAKNTEIAVFKAKGQGPESFSVEVDSTTTKIQYLVGIYYADCQKTLYQCPCTHTCTFNVLADTKSLQKKIHGLKTAAREITVFPQLHVAPFTSGFTVIMFCSGSCHRYSVDMGINQVYP